MLWVDFTGAPDSPSPTFPGASGLRETIDENTKMAEHATAGGLIAVMHHPLIEDAKAGLADAMSALHQWSQPVDATPPSGPGNPR